MSLTRCIFEIKSVIVKVAINSGLGDMLHFFPFAVQLSKKQPFEIVGNKYSAELCALAGLENVTHNTAHTVLMPPPGATVARIKRYGEKTYRQIYSEATGVDGDKREAWAALGISNPSPENLTVKTLICDIPRASGLGSKLFTPNLVEFSAELVTIAGEFDKIEPLTQQATLHDLLVCGAYASAGIGQIGFLTALCQLFEKPFYAVRGDGEPDDRFAARKRVVHL